jgi:hypothetical protein
VTTTSGEKTAGAVLFFIFRRHCQARRACPLYLPLQSL